MKHLLTNFLRMGSTVSTPPIRSAMRSILLLLGLFLSVSVWGEDVTIYAENFGDNGSSNTAVASATCYSASTTMFTTGHQTSVASNYSSDGKVGKNSVSPSDNSGASGNSAVWYQAGTGTNTKTLFQVSNINIANYSSLALKFNLYRMNGASSSNYVTVTYKIDNGTAQTLTYTAPSSNATWTWCSGNLMGTGNSLSITFTMHTTGGFTHRIDDIALTGTASSGSTPSVSLDPDDALNFATVGVGDPAPAAQSFTITGSNMTAALSIADLTNFDYSVTSGSLSPSEGSISATVTVTPKSGFTTNAEDKSETLTISGDDLDDDIELALNAEVKAKHDIIFDTDLKSIANVSVMEDETYNITETIEAALIASCTYTKFEGWTTVSSIADASVKPTLVNSVTMSTNNVTLKPVFSKTIASGGISGSTIIDYEKLSLGSYADGTNKDDYSWSYTQLMKGTNNTIQGNSSKSSILWNTIEFPAAISKIELVVGNAAGAANTAALSFGSEAKPTSNDIALGNGTSYALNETGTLTIEDGIPANSTYVSLSWTSGASYFTSLKVYYGSDGTTTYSLDPGCAAAGQCYAPSFSPAAGTFDVAQDITLQTSTPSSHIYYTLDGSDPDDNSDEYSIPIHITRNTTIKAITYADGLTESSISEGVFNIRYAQPTFSPAEGEYTTAQNVTISATEADAIYYTTNGEDPTVDPANLYNGNAIEINTTGSHTIKAIAVKAGYANSNVASATYVMDLPYANIAAFIAGEPTTAKSLTLNNAIITGVDGTTLYIQDETAGIMIYGLSSLPENAAPNHSISGTIVGKYSLYRHQHELVKPNNTTPIDISNVTISADEVTRPAISEYTSLSAAYAAKPMMLVKLIGVSYDGTEYEFDGNKIYNTFGALTDKTMPETTVDCDITGVVIDYNGTLELLPVFATDIVADADAADPTVSPAGGADAENAVTAAAVEITAAADTKVNGLDATTIDINSTTPAEVSVTVTRDFYRSVNYSCGWYKAAAAKYDINGQGATTEGAVVAKVAGVEAATAAEGDDVHVFITPNAHSHLATILVNGAAPTEVTAGEEYSFEMPGEAVTIAVTWTEDEKYALTFTAGEGSGDAPAISGNEYYEGDVIPLPANTFTYDAQHKFTKWLIDGTEYAAGASYTMPAAPTEAVAQWKTIPNFAGGDWILVKDAAELTEGSYVIIASAEVNEAMKPYAGGSDKNCKTEEAAIDNGLLTYNNVFAVYEIREGNKINTFALQDISSDYYLYAASSSSNDMKTEETLTDNSSWTASITSTGDATLVAQGSNTRNVMHYNPNGTNPSVFSCYANNSTVTGLVTLYKYHTPSLKLSYDKNAGDDVVTGMPSMGIADGENKVTISDATPLREGYLFDGWNSNPLGGGTAYAANAEVTLDANLTLYAQWQAATAHSLSYDKNGGEGDIPDATNYYPNADVTLADAITKEGYIFAGWEYDGNVYAAGTQFTMPNVAVVMTAKFAQGAVYTITSRESVSAQGAPEGSNATFVNTYNNDKCQLTSGNSMTLTLSGYDLYTIKALTLRMRSNAGGGKGTLSVTIGDNAVSFTTNKWYDGTHHSGSYEDIQVTLTQTRVMPGEDVVIKIEASQNSLYCQSFAVEYERVLDEIRGELFEGKWGTICSDKKVMLPTGASFYQLNYMELNTDGSPYKFFFDEIGENASLEAGKPYVFIAESEVIKGVKVGDAVTGDDHAYNGFVGYTGDGKHISSSYNSYSSTGYNYYGLNSSNIFQLIYSTSGTTNILKERAYVEISPERAPATSEQPRPAYSKRRLVVGAGAPAVTTGMDELNASEAPVKVMIDGRLFIIRGEKMYNANGQLVK